MPFFFGIGRFHSKGPTFILRLFISDGVLICSNHSMIEGDFYWLGRLNSNRRNPVPKDLILLSEGIFGVFSTTFVPENIVLRHLKFVNFICCRCDYGQECGRNNAPIRREALPC